MDEGPMQRALNTAVLAGGGAMLGGMLYQSSTILLLPILASEIDFEFVREKVWNKAFYGWDLLESGIYWSQVGFFVHPCVFWSVGWEKNTSFENIVSERLHAPRQNMGRSERGNLMP